MAAARRVKKIHRHLCEARELSDEEIVQAMELYWSGSPTPAYDGKVTAWDRETQTMSMEYSGCTADSGLTHDGVGATNGRAGWASIWFLFIMDIANMPL